MLCEELILPRDFGNCTDIERSEAQPRTAGSCREEAGQRGGPGPAFGDGGGRAESGDWGSRGWGKGKGEAEMGRMRGR